VVVVPTLLPSGGRTHDRFDSPAHSHRRRRRSHCPPSPPPSSLGDPFSLGLVSFGVSALVLATVLSGMIDPLTLPAALALAFALGFFIERIAGVLHFMRGETFPGTVFTAYAGFWLSYALLVQYFLPPVVAADGDTGASIGMFMLAWAVFSTYMLLASVRTTRTVLTIFVLLTAVFYLAAFGSFPDSTSLSKAAGYVLVLDALVALYLSAASIVNETWGRTLLPAP
jgi:succinate-acetate transporter protein